MRKSLVGIALLLTAACGADDGRPAAAPSPGASHAFRGVDVEPIGSRPSFVLRDTAGNRFDFAAETKGRPTLLYFGYVNCPDECPTAMADIAAALRVAREYKDDVRVVFVATDPPRDTPQLVRRFLDQFSTTFVGLVGTKAEVEAAQKAVGIEPAKKEGPITTLPGKPDEHAHEPGTAPHQHFGPLGYGVGHANVIFAYDAADRLPVVYPGGVVPSDIAADLPALAKGNAS